MRRVPFGNTTRCIDKTEVTVAEYQKFLADKNKPLLPSTEQGASRCNAITDFKPGGDTETCTGESCLRAQAYVNQCDAKRFCAWAGKKLCGNTSTTPLGVSADEMQDPTKNDWMNACFTGGREWPYGEDYKAANCNTNDPTKKNLCGAPVVTGSFPNCQAPVGSYDQVFDLSGNVSEWMDASIEGKSWPELKCVVMGGAFEHYWGDAGCKGGRMEWPCDSKNKAFGFRCCSE